MVLLLASMAHGAIDGRCRGLERPADYDEVQQQDFLQNYAALSSSFSALRSPVPYEPGRGSVGVEISAIPPLSCRRRYVLEWTKTEDTNRSPVLPRLRVGMSLRRSKGLVPYAMVGLVPPVPVDGIHNLILSAAVGLGAFLGDRWQGGLRLHVTSQRTIGDIATAFEEDDPVHLDAFHASSLGADLSIGWTTPSVVPYASLGFLDVSSLFVVGDDGAIVNNHHPYAGLAVSLGASGTVRWFQWGVEGYAAPAGHSRPRGADGPAYTFTGRYGHLYTARVLLGAKL